MSAIYDPREPLVINFLNDEHDFLSSYSGIIGWSQAAGLTTRWFSKRSAEDEVETLEAVQRLRKATMKIADSALKSQDPPAWAVRSVNKIWLAQHDTLTYDAGYMRSPGAARGPRDLAPLIAREIVGFLEHEDLTRVKRCPSCEKLFYDRSSGRTRIWCNMKTCGNRANVQQFRRRTQANKSDQKKS